MLAEEDKIDRPRGMIPMHPLEMVETRGRYAKNDGGDEPAPYQKGKGEQSWKQLFQDLQQELSHMKEVVNGRAPISMDALVQ